MSGPVDDTVHSGYGQGVGMLCFMGWRSLLRAVSYEILLTTERGCPMCRCTASCPCNLLQPSPSLRCQEWPCWLGGSQHATARCKLCVAVDIRFFAGLESPRWAHPTRIVGDTVLEALKRDLYFCDCTVRIVRCSTRPVILLETASQQHEPFTLHA
jgi:hypothetical protein